jgi:transposase
LAYIYDGLGEYGRAIGGLSSNIMVLEGVRPSQCLGPSGDNTVTSRACERQLGSQRTIADMFGVSLAFVEKVLRQYCATGDIPPKPHAGGQKLRPNVAPHTIVQRLVGDHPDATLEALYTGAAGETGLRVSVPTMCRVLQRLGLSRKKSRSLRRSAIRRGSNRRGRSIICKSL